MCKSFYTVLFSAVLLVGALSFASTVAAQEESTSEETTSEVTTADETTFEETTMLGADAANRQVDAQTDNVSVEREGDKVSAKTSDVSTSNETSSQQSSVTVQQDQADEGSGSEANTGDVNIAQNSNSSCKNPDKVLSVGSTTNNIRRAFETTGNTFRVTYDVDFTDDNDFSNFAEIDIEDNFGLVDFVNLDTDTDGSNSFVVTEGAGNYDLVVNIDPPNGARYTITVDDCRGSNDNNRNRNNDNNRNNRNRNNDNNRNNRIIVIDRDNDGNRDGNRVVAVDGAARSQYGEDKVIVETVPDKGRLADTGGLPLAGVAFLALASVGLGLSILRFATRREP